MVGKEDLHVFVFPAAALVHFHVLHDPTMKNIEKKYKISFPTWECILRIYIIHGRIMKNVKMEAAGWRESC